MGADAVRRLEAALDLAIKSGNQAKIDRCRTSLKKMRRAVAEATRTLGPTKTSSESAQAKTGKRNSPAGLKRAGTEPSVSRADESDSGIRFSQDPDAGSRAVWAFKTGGSFHRSDCHVVESRDGAVQISIQAARNRNLERCMHCVPTVR
jgi:hypothetical protein